MSIKNVLALFLPQATYRSKSDFNSVFHRFKFFIESETNRLTFFQSLLPFCGSARWPLCVPRSGRPDWLSTERDCWVSPPETPHHPSNRPWVNIKSTTMSFFPTQRNASNFLRKVLHVEQFFITSCLRYCQCKKYHVLTAPPWRNKTGNVLMFWS